jgi:hypothetical protein
MCVVRFKSAVHRENLRDLFVVCLTLAGNPIIIIIIILYIIIVLNIISNY